jgi:hypothetical protein
LEEEEAGKPWRNSGMVMEAGWLEMPTLLLGRMHVNMQIFMLNISGSEDKSFSWIANELCLIINPE